MVGFAVQIAKVKFDKDSASYLSKVTNFEPSSTFTRASEQLIDLEKAKDNELERLGLELRTQLQRLRIWVDKLGLIVEITRLDKDHNLRDTV